MVKVWGSGQMLSAQMTDGIFLPQDESCSWPDSMFPADATLPKKNIENTTHKSVTELFTERRHTHKHPPAIFA